MSVGIDVPTSYNVVTLHILGMAMNFTLQFLPFHFSFLLRTGEKAILTRYSAVLLQPFSSNSDLL